MTLLRALLAFLLATCATAHAGGSAARVTRVSDGDTLWVRAGRTPPKLLRLQGIDAPELCQPFGAEAQRALAQRVLHERVTVRRRGRDDYDRQLAEVVHQDEDVGAWLVANGYAWADRFRRQASPYAALEDDARRARRGLWAQSWHVPPREFRRQHGRCQR